MKVLFVSEQFPYPLDTGGNVRTFHLLRALGRQHDVTLLCAGRSELSPADVGVIRAFCSDVRLVPPIQANFTRELRALYRSVTKAAPYVIERHRNLALQCEVASLLAEADPPFEAVHFNHLDAALYLDLVPPDVFRVLDEHNVVSNQVKTTLETEPNWLRRTVLRMDYPRLRRFEAALCNQMHTCLVCSAADAAALQAVGVRARTAVIPNGVDLDYFPCTPAQLHPPELLFLGTLDYDPCEKGVWYFCTQILPLIRQKLPEVRFVAVGRNPSERLQRLAQSEPGITLTGRVPDVRPHVYRSSVFVVPLLSGSGTRLKILEAMAMGVPVVTTTIGVEGIDAVSGRHVLIADTPPAFADAVLTVLANPSRAQKMVAESRRLVQSKYSWDSIRTCLLEQYRETAGEIRQVRTKA